jgi:hypothetical protein
MAKSGTSRIQLGFGQDGREIVSPLKCVQKHSFSANPLSFKKAQNFMGATVCSYFTTTINTVLKIPKMDV